MKLLQFLVVLATFSIVLVAFIGTAKAKDATFKGTETERVVIVSIEHPNGSISEYTIPESQLQSQGLDLEFGEIWACTYKFSNGECSVTASTCEAARAGFEACACAAGHTRFCSVQ